jgi:hypothetical protein
LFDVGAVVAGEAAAADSKFSQETTSLNFVFGF